MATLTQSVFVTRWQNMESKGVVYNTASVIVAAIRRGDNFVKFENCSTLGDLRDTEYLQAILDTAVDKGREQGVLK